MATKDELRAKLRIPAGRLDAINDLLLDPDARVVNDLLDVIARYGTPQEINRKAADARRLDNLLLRLAERDCEYLDEIQWLTAQRDAGAFVSEAEYRRSVLGAKAADDDLPG